MRFNVQPSGGLLLARQSYRPCLIMDVDTSNRVLCMLMALGYKLVNSLLHCHKNGAWGDVVELPFAVGLTHSGAT